MKITDRTLVIRATQIAPGTVPGEIQVVPFGKWKGYKGAGGELVEFEVTKELGLKAIQYHRQFDERFPQRDLPIDYEHQTLSGGEAPAAGWYKNLYLKSDGIYTKVKEWTKKAEQYLLNKEYRYQSPVLMFNDVDGETGEKIPLWISSIALTNSPFLNGIAPVVAKDFKDSAIIFLTDSNSQQINGGNTMLQKILEMLGLPAEATLETIEQKIKALLEAPKTAAAKYKAAMTALGLTEDASADDVSAFALKHTSILQELGVKATDTIDQIKQVIVSAKQPGQQIDLKQYVLKSDFDALQVQLTEREFSEMINGHTQRGAVAKHEVEDFKADVKGNKISCKDLDARLKKRPDYSVVPLQEIEAKNAAPASSGLDANTIQIAASMGVSKEDLDKYGK